MARNTRFDVIRSRSYVFHCLSRADMLHGDFETGKVGHQGFHNFFDKDGLPFENVRVCHFRMNAQHHVLFLHFFQSRIAVLNVSDTKIRVGRRSRWIILAADDTSSRSLADFVGRSLIRQIKRHERFQRRTRRKRPQNMLTVFKGLFRCRHGWFRVGHDETATETLGSVLQDSGGFGTFANVVMEIIRHAHRYAGAWRSFFSAHDAAV
jgi:hypothetical protein